MLVSLYLFVDMVGLKLGKNLNDCLLHSCLGHKTWIIWIGKHLISDLDSLNRLHSVSNLVWLGHELASKLLLLDVSRGLEDKDVSLLAEIDLVQKLNRWVSCVQVDMEMRNVLICKSFQLFDLQKVGDRLLKGNLVGMVCLH